jgi:hypothetical protein
MDRLNSVVERVFLGGGGGGGGGGVRGARPPLLFTHSIVDHLFTLFLTHYYSMGIVTQGLKVGGWAGGGGQPPVCISCLLLFWEQSAPLRASFLLVCLAPCC